jgi:hypothetical protein
MTIEEALRRVERSLEVNFDWTSSIPDVELSPAKYYSWLKTLDTFALLSQAQMAQKRYDMQQNLLLEIDGRIDRL